MRAIDGDVMPEFLPGATCGTHPRSDDQQTVGNPAGGARAGSCNSIYGPRGREIGRLAVHLIQSASCGVLWIWVSHHFVSKFQAERQNARTRAIPRVEKQLRSGCGLRAMTCSIYSAARGAPLEATTNDDCRSSKGPRVFMTPPTLPTNSRRDTVKPIDSLPNRPRPYTKCLRLIGRNAFNVDRRLPRKMKTAKHL